MKTKAKQGQAVGTLSQFRLFIKIKIILFLNSSVVLGKKHAPCAEFSTSHQHETLTISEAYCRQSKDVLESSFFFFPQKVTQLGTQLRLSHIYLTFKIKTFNDKGTLRLV